MRACLATIVLVTAVDVAAAGQAARGATLQERAREMSRPAALRAIMAAEDGRLVLPDDLHTPAIDALRLTQIDDVQLLRELARSRDVQVQQRAIRALGRLERREVIPDLLQYLTSSSDNPIETADALAQALRGESLALDAAGQQVKGVFDVLAQLGEISTTARFAPRLEAISRSIGRLPYERAEQVQAADTFLFWALRVSDPDPETRMILPGITRAIETLARVNIRFGALDPETIEWLRGIVNNRRHTYVDATRHHAMAALIATRGVDAETLRNAARATSAPELRRLAVVALAGAGAAVVPTERTELLTTLLSDKSVMVRLEAVRAWARQESETNGCQRLIDGLKDPSLTVVLAATDALGDQCKDDMNVTDRLTVEAGTPPPNEWHRQSHALVALAKRAPGRVFIPLLGAHVRHVTWQVRMYAARAAGITNEVSALERLAYDENDNVREASLAALRRLKGDEAEPYFVAALARSDYQLLRTAANELKGAKPTPQLAAGLLDALKRVTAEKKETSRDTRVALLDRLRELGAPDQAGALVPLLEDFDIPVAQLAGVVLQEWTGRPQEIAPQLLARPVLPLDVELKEAGDTPGRIKLGSGKTLVMSLRPDIAPLTSVRVLRLAKAGYYNGLTFHRVVPNFVIQGGSPDANEYSGDAHYMRDEISRASHVPGSVGLSTRGRDTGDAQFFINLVDNARLDFEYTVFGSVAGDLDAIAEGETIESIKFEKVTTDEKVPASASASTPCASVRACVGVRSMR